MPASNQLPDPEPHVLANFKLSRTLECEFINRKRRGGDRGVSSTAHHHFKDAQARREFFAQLEESSRALEKFDVPPESRPITAEDVIRSFGGRMLGQSQNTGRRDSQSRSQDRGIV
jgi:hypothetical protein